MRRDKIAHHKAPSDSATDSARSIAAAQNGSVLAMLQSVEYATDTLAGCIGEGAGWTLVTLIEAWKCACRYRLLQLTAPGELLRSFVSEGKERKTLASAVQRLRTSMAPFEHVCAVDPLAVAAAERDTYLVRIGEVLHVVQPFAYILLLLAQQRGASSLSDGWRRRLPWLVAIGLEIVSLQLCALGTARLEASQQPQRQLRAPRPASALVLNTSIPLHAPNRIELRHRRLLLAYLILRPLARVMAKRMLERGLPPATPAGAHSASWRQAPLEALTLLETAIWARYWR